MQVLPPPNVTGALHIGHALTAAIQCITMNKECASEQSHGLMTGPSNNIYKELKFDYVDNFDRHNSGFTNSVSPLQYHTTEKYQVLYRFLEFVSNFDWENFCVNLWGPVPVSPLPDVTAEPPRKDSGELLLNKVFLDACSSLYAVFPGGQDNQGQTFVSKHFNVIDPLRVSNNLGCSVSKVLQFVRYTGELSVDAVTDCPVGLRGRYDLRRTPTLLSRFDLLWLSLTRQIWTMILKWYILFTIYIMMSIRIENLLPLALPLTRLTAMVARNEFRRRRRSTAATIVVNSSRRYRVCVLVLATVVDSGTS
ncbi:unnamed protein product [Lactuca saligna]|uniref:PAP/OAS1 substrate-binding-related domain-containing protein n=1 Tax=Lactuca saligna TaxID=75948 RepID=A0AA35YA28_LACSI|nr:unnamed protein product [Lactuca saligna]